MRPCTSASQLNYHCCSHLFIHFASIPRFCLPVAEETHRVHLAIYGIRVVLLLYRLFVILSGNYRTSNFRLFTHHHLSANPVVPIRRLDWLNGTSWEHLGDRNMLLQTTHYDLLDVRSSRTAVRCLLDTAPPASVHPSLARTCNSLDYRNPALIAHSG